MSFSPDLSCLAWVESEKWAIISFADLVVDENAANPAEVPLFEPGMNHLAGRRGVHPAVS